MIAAAEASDAACQSVLDDAVSALASLCLNIKAAIDVECVAIGGSVGLSGAFQVRLGLLIAGAPPAFRIKVVPAALGADAGLVGIAAWSEELILPRFSDQSRPAIRHDVLTPKSVST